VLGRVLVGREERAGAGGLLSPGIGPQSAPIQRPSDQNTRPGRARSGDARAASAAVVHPSMVRILLKLALIRMRVWIAPHRAGTQVDMRRKFAL